MFNHGESLPIGRYWIRADREERGIDESARPSRVQRPERSAFPRSIPDLRLTPGFRQIPTHLDDRFAGLVSLFVHEENYTAPSRSRSLPLSEKIKIAKKRQSSKDTFARPITSLLRSVCSSSI